jgi:hypothetical protein
MRAVSASQGAVFDPNPLKDPKVHTLVQIGSFRADTLL